MQGTGKSYEVSGENTEWEDILISKGITTQENVYLGKGLNPEAVSYLVIVFISLKVKVVAILHLHIYSVFFINILVQEGCRGGGRRGSYE